MQGNHQYTVEELVLDNSFVNYCLDTCTSDSSHWKTIIRDHPEQQQVFEEARQWVLALHGGLSASEINRQIEKVRQQLQERRITETPMQLEEQPVLSSEFVVQEDGRIRKRNLRQILFYAAAAVVILVISFSTVRWLGPGRNNDSVYNYTSLIKSKKLAEEINTSDELRSFTLPDGSRVQLHPGSRLAYAMNIDSADQRDVYLSGEAFFDVKKNPARPFRVFSNEIVTKVLGTSFTVKSFEKDKTISVTVRTGKVSVYSQTGHEGNSAADTEKSSAFLLTPNQQLVYKKEQKAFEKQLLDRPAVIVPGLLQDTVYEDVPVITIFEEMKTAYGIAILYDKETLRDCTITANLSDESLYRKLDLICEAIEARYEVINAQVYVYAGGCTR